MATTLTIDLPSERWQQLVDLAQRVGLTPEALVRATIDDLLERPDATYRQALEYVLAKNAELYRRLA
ncbi:MAG: DNA-binding protein [Chloroflexi bacterium]|nr:DNA-binding protein [Chloroflexota bacterium]